jgi:cell division protein ZapA (FtsZ GTPase activity inhibitor)
VIGLSTVKILGREYRLRGDEDGGHLEEVAAYLDRVMREMLKQVPDTQDAAVLAALNIASELMSLRASLVRADRVQSLIDLVDTV